MDSIPAARDSTSSAQQSGVGDEEGNDEVQPAAHPRRRRGVPVDEHATLVDQRENNADDDGDAHGPP